MSQNWVRFVDFYGINSFAISVIVLFILQNGTYFPNALGIDIFLNICTFLYICIRKK